MCDKSGNHYPSTTASDMELLPKVLQKDEIKITQVMCPPTLSYGFYFMCIISFSGNLLQQFIFLINVFHVFKVQWSTE